MEARRVLTTDWLTIAGYGGGGFRIETARHDGSILIHREAVTAWTGAYQIDTLDPLTSLNPPPELIILGTGPTFNPTAAKLASEIRKLGIASDIMATPAACRTYNILIGDGRNAAAALLAVD